MRESRLQSWALAAEIIGGVAVVLSLILVAYELNQSNQQAALNTSALEIAAYQDLIESISNLNSTALQDPAVLRAVALLQSEPEPMNDEDRQRTSIYLMTLFRHGDMAYFQYERGAIDEKRLNSVLRIVTDRLEHPYIRSVWERSRDRFIPEYRDYIENLMSKKQ
jgi:hypothetical protein